jgi:hypothetical protein
MRTALVLGGANSVWADVQAALEIGEYSSVVGCNDVGIVWPGVMDAWVSLHGYYLQAWANRRQSKGLPPHAALYGHAEAPAVTHVTPYKFPGQDHSGSSGLSGHHQIAWLECQSQIKDRVRSMSGWTANLLGRPDAAWLA